MNSAVPLAPDRCNMATTSTSVRRSTPGSSDLLSATLLFSIILHGVFILGLTFTPHEARPDGPTMDVTLVNTANQQDPDEADYLAQASNTGGGNSDKARRPTQPVSGLMPTPTNGMAPRVLTPSASEPEQTNDPDRVTTRGDGDFTIQSDTADDESRQKTQRETTETQKRHARMAKLAAEIDEESEAYAKRPHKKFISANTREHAYAAYMDTWAQNVEHVGTLNFPDAARAGTTADNLMLTVGINRDGSIHSIRVIHSSGRKVLDDAARHIVHMAAPFDPIPETDSEVDQLYITRTYRFLSGGKLQTH